MSYLDNLQNIVNSNLGEGTSTGQFLKNYGITILIFVLLIGIIIFYFAVIYRRIPRQLKTMEAYKPLMNQATLSDCSDLLGKGYKLCDFNILSSYKSYLPYQYYYDYASTDAIIECLRYGARYIDLDVFNKTFEDCTEPTVAYGTEIGQWKYTSEITLEDCLVAIADYAFSNEINNYSDPLFINLNIKVEQNSQTVNKIAKLITDIFRERLMPPEYGYQGRFSGINIGIEDIDKFVGKVIIIADKDFKNTDLDELVNICPTDSSGGGNLRELTISQVETYENISELKEFNQTRFTRITPPEITSRTRGSYNYIPAWYSGCQFINMNLPIVDEFTYSYMKRFEKSSLVLKPDILRYRPLTIAPPKPQTPAVAMNTKTEILADGTAIRV